MLPCINKRVKEVLGNYIVTQTPAALTDPSSVKQSATYLTYKVFLSPFSQLISFSIPFQSPSFSFLWKILPHDLLLETMENRIHLIEDVSAVYWCANFVS